MTGADKEVDFDGAIHKWSGKKVTGRVTRVTPYGLTLEVPGLPRTSAAFLHVSQVSDSYVQSLEAEFTVGQTLEVMILRLKSDPFPEWEVSLWALVCQARWQVALPEGSKATGRVERIGDMGALVSIGPGLVGRIPQYYCDALVPLGLVGLGKSIEVQIGEWDWTGDGPILVPSLETTAQGVIQSINSYIHMKQHKLHRWLEVVVQELGSVKCSVSHLVCIEERFHVGDSVTVEIDTTMPGKRLLRHGHSRMFRVAISEEQQARYGAIPPLGSTFDAVVMTVTNYGAFCMLADSINGLVHRTQIVNDQIPEMERYVSPGDVLRVRILPPGPKDKGYHLEFISLVKRSGVQGDEADVRARLFSLTGEKLRHVKGGFTRDESFRPRVVEAYKHTCAICGADQRITLDMSAAEAAHIVPRSERGADTPENAICLCRLCHWAFDNGLVGIRDDGCVWVSRLVVADSNAARNLTSLNGKQVDFPGSVPKPLEALRWHLRNVFLDTAGRDLP